MHAFFDASAILPLLLEEPTSVAHLFVYERASHALPELALVTFDQGMEQAAAALGSRLWQPDA